ncbi:MAG: hypothetical protein HYV02_07040 [Deltaproteobacteria bacterium]|nr:hypothetical protein [Deltaproteobacteria bacterium]
MLRFFFHYCSPFPLFLEMASVVGLAGFFRTRGSATTWTALEMSGPLALVVTYLVLRFFGSVRWYRRLPHQRGGTRPLGIENHFRRINVLGSYSLAMATALLWGGLPPVLLWGLAIVQGFFVYVSGVLLYFHLTDDSALRVNVFSHRAPTLSHTPRSMPGARPQRAAQVT